MHARYNNLNIDAAPLPHWKVNSLLPFTAPSGTHSSLGGSAFTVSASNVPSGIAYSGQQLQQALSSAST